MLNVQGAVAEYERAKIAERTRRGKVYWARQGADAVCRARWVRADAADQAVWEAVAGLLRDPALLAAEYRRRLGEAAPDPQRRECHFVH